METTQYPLISMTAVFFPFEALQEFDITCFLSIAMVEDSSLVVPWAWVDGVLAPTNTDYFSFVNCSKENYQGSCSDELQQQQALFV